MKKKILLTKDRPMTNISMRMPVDLIETLKKVAPLKQMSGYQSLIKYYIGQGLLNDNDLVSRMAMIGKEENPRLRFTRKVEGYLLSYRGVIGWGTRIRTLATGARIRHVRTTPSNFS